MYNLLCSHFFLTPCHRNVEYYNAKGSFVDSHTVLARHENGDEVMESLLWVN